ncbi:MAG: TolC family protein [Candidatus Marinimicrobia bacterium]|nr:TolC family protein [Candidatus Neomarinimicrobiota bacterium]
MKRTKISIFSIILILSSVIYTQELSLNDCVNIALENKETLQSAQLDLKFAKVGKVGALSNILPSLSFSSGRNETSYAKNDLFPTSTSWSAGITGAQNIFDGGGWWNRIAQANNNFKIAQQLERQMRINVIAEVHRAYFQLLKKQQLLEVSKQSLELAEQQVELAQKKYDLGAANKTDLLKSEVARGTAKSVLITQQALLYVAISELRNAMGMIGDNSELIISEEILPLQSVPDFAEAIDILEENNPGILAAEAQLTDANLRKKLAMASRLPSLNASLSYQASDTELNGLTNAFKNEWMMTIGLNLSFPIFNGMALSTQSQQAKLAVQKQENDVTTVINDAIVRSESLLGIVGDYFKIIPINEEVLASAEEDFKLVSERYRLGSASILELLDAQVSVTRARVDLVSSKYDARIQQAYLKAQLGILDQVFDKN